MAYREVLLLGLQLQVDHPFHPSFEQTCLQDLEDLQLNHLVVHLGMGILEGSLVGVHLLQHLGILEEDLLVLVLLAKSLPIDLAMKHLN